jgi:Ca2+:H+ antiporter
LIVVLTGAAGGAHYLGFSPLLAFALATLALAGLAWTVSFATEQLGERLGPAATGFLQSTLGNLPELFVVVFALHAGETVVAQTSIIGSFFANALLILGLTVVAGARRAKSGVMRFHPRLPNDTATLMILATFITVLIGISVASSDHASKHVTALSIVGSICLLVVYGRWLWGYLRDGSAQPGHGRARVAAKQAVALLFVAGVAAAFVSDWFVAALQPTITQLHLSQAFAGLVIVAIASSAVVNVAGVTLAWKGQADLAISVVKNSVAQVIAFLFPLLVLISLLFTHPLSFSLAPVYIGALLVSALAIWQITGGGEAAEFEGLALIALYVVLATLALYE